MLHEVRQADTRAAVERAFDRFLATFRDKYPRATASLTADRDRLLAFYDFPAVDWQHLRTTNPIESTFVTISLRMASTGNCYSDESGLALLHQLAMSPEKRWRRLRGFKQLVDVIDGVKFVDGVDERELSREAAA